MKNKILCHSLALSAILCTAAIIAAASCAYAESREEMTKMLREHEYQALAQIYPIKGIISSDDVRLSPEHISQWWDVFEDPIMTELIRKALADNRGIEAARAKTKAARASLGVSRAALSPWLSTEDFWSNSRTPVSAGGSGSGGSLYKLGIDASWEIDVFGGNTAKLRAEKMTMEAEYAALYSAWTSLASETAVNYITLRTLQEQLEIAQYNLKLQSETVDIQQSKVKAGLTDELALKQAQTVQEQTRAAIPEIEASIANTMNVLAVLTGALPGELDKLLAEKKPVPQLEGWQYVGIPANALRQRADIREAERRLAAQAFRKKAARAELYPKLYLIGSIGTEAGSFDDLFHGASKFYSFMPKISWPIFNAGSIRNNIKAQGAIEEQLLAAYEQTVLNAVAEVRSALIDNEKGYEIYYALEKAYKSANDALTVANDKYANGLVDFMNVINAQNTLVNVSAQYVKSKGALAANAVRIFKALGGGWKAMDEAEAAAAEEELAAHRSKRNAAH